VLIQLARWLEKVLRRSRESSHQLTLLPRTPRSPQVVLVGLPEAVRQWVNRFAVRAGASLQVGVEFRHGGAFSFPVALHPDAAGMHFPLVQERVAVQAVPLELVPT